MQKIDMHLILTTTNGLFDEKQVPSLYVQIQNHKELIENELNIKISFQEAVLSWMENCYIPVLEKAKSSALKIAYPQKSTSQLYLMLTKRMKTCDEINLDTAYKTLLEESKHRIRKIIAKTIA